MKIMLIAILAVGLIGGAMADVDSVVSQNVVGYVKLDAPADGAYDIVALAQFSEEEVHIQDAIDNIADLNAGTVGNYAAADRLLVWTGIGYQTFGLFQPAEGEPYWMASGEAAWNLDIIAGVPADVTLKRSQAVWFRTGTGAEPASVVVSGDVPVSVVEVDVVQGFNLLAIPYTATVNLQDLVIDGATAGTVGNFASADKIYAWTGIGYQTFGLFQPAEGEPYWMASGQAAWNLDIIAGVPADVEVDIGKGFWYGVPGAAKTIGFEAPYTLD